MKTSKYMIGLGFLAFTGVSAQAMGPKPPSSGGPSYTLPNPVRHVIVRSFQNVHAFETPNQVVTTMQDAQNQLGNILNEVVTQSGLSVVQPGGMGDMDPCGTHLELAPAVTDFTMDAVTANIQFGFNSLGTIDISKPTVTAQDTVHLGSIRFVLSLYECGNNPGSDCQSLISKDASQTVLGNDFKIQVTYQTLGASGDIFTKTDLGNAVGKILTSGMKKIVSSSAMAQVPWSAKVVAVGSDGSITMTAGANSGIKGGQYFTVYARSEGGNSCGIFEALDCVATTEIDGPSSVASVYRKLSAGASRPIEVGDVVYVGAPSCAP